MQANKAKQANKILMLHSRQSIQKPFPEQTPASPAAIFLLCSHLATQLGKQERIQTKKRKVCGLLAVCRQIANQKLFILIKFSIKIETVMTHLQKSQTTKLRLNVRCEELEKIFYKDHLKGVLVIKAQRHGKEPLTIFTSQTMQDSFNPTFPEEILLEHSFEENQRYIFQIYNHGHHGNPIGQVKLTMKELLAAPDGQAVKELQSGFKVGGRMVIQCSLVERNSQFIWMRLKGEGLRRHSWWEWVSAPRLFLKVSRVWPNNSQSLYVSQCKPYDKIMQWNQFCIEYSPKYEEQNSRLKVQVINEKTQSEETLAEAELEWLQLEKTSQFDVLDKEGQKAGHFVIDHYRMEQEHSFHEFVKAGLDVNFTIAIDFSASIKHHAHHQSPHHTGKGSSRYLDALQALSSFIIDYSTGHHASVFAVGAKVKHPKVYTGEKVQQCFPLNGDFERPQLYGAEAITAAYHDILNHLEFSGPTDFTQVVRKAMASCLEGKRRKEEFSVLVILSDGKIFNREELKAVLLECATLPIYIVLLAVDSDGKEMQDLSSVKMEVLTGDKSVMERQHMINVGGYLKDGKLDDIAHQLFKNLPHVVSHYMSLRKRTPTSLERAIRKKLNGSNSNGSRQNINPEV